MLELAAKLREWPTEAIWRIKNAITYSPPPLKWSWRSPDPMERGLSDAERLRARELALRYEMSPWARVRNRREYIENLYLLDVLDRYVTPVASENCLDIGAKSWTYLPALHSFTPGPWDGVELDCYQRRWNMVTRRAYAESIARHCPGSRYIPGTLLDLQGKYSFITWILPFVTPGPLKYWGLPSRYYQPALLLRHAWQLLKPGGVMFIMNQGEKEGAAQRHLFEEEKIPARYLGVIASEFSPFVKMRVGWLTSKPK